MTQPRPDQQTVLDRVARMLQGNNNAMTIVDLGAKYKAQFGNRLAQDLPSPLDKLRAAGHLFAVEDKSTGALVSLLRDGPSSAHSSASDRSAAADKKTTAAPQPTSERGNVEDC